MQTSSAPRRRLILAHPESAIGCPNDYGNHVPYDDYLRAFSQIKAPVVFPTATPNRVPRHNIWPTETAPVIRRRDDGAELVQLRWGFPPAQPKGAPVINFRCEGRWFPKRTLPDPGLALSRVHRREITEVEMEIHQAR